MLFNNVLVSDFCQSYAMILCDIQADFCLGPWDALMLITCVHVCTPRGFRKVPGGPTNPRFHRSKEVPTGLQESSSQSHI